MGPTGRLILIHAWLFCWVAFCLGMIRGRMAEATYDARMSSRFRRFLMPGRLVDRVVWVRQQKLLARVALVLGVLIYAMVLLDTLS